MENNNIKQEIIKTIKNDEISSLKEKEHLISVKDILITYKRKYEDKMQTIYPVIKLLQRNLPYLCDVVFYKDVFSPKKDSIILWLKFNREIPIYYGKLDKNLMLRYQQGNLSFLNPIGILENMQKIIAKDKELYVFLAKYGIDNNYHLDPIIHTVSGNFKLNMFDDSFTILNNYNLLSNDKYFKLIYDHENSKKGLETEYGMFRLDTNIGGLNQFFSSKGKRVNPIPLFLEHLKVYEDDVPNHVKVKIKKSKN